MHMHTHPSCVARSYPQTILSFRIPYTLSALISHSAVPTHCACQSQCTERLAEQVSHICKISHLYRTISLDGQRRKLCTLLLRPRTEGCHYKGRFSLPYSKNKRVLATSAIKQFRLASHNTIGRSEATLATPVNKTGTENNINIYFTVKQL